MATSIKIHTGLYTQKTYDILNMFHVYNNNYCISITPLMTRNLRCAKPVREPNGEVVWEITTKSNKNNTYLKQDYKYSSYYKFNNDSDRIRTWLAHNLKQTTINILFRDQRIKRRKGIDISEYSHPNIIWKKHRDVDMIVIVNNKNSSEKINLATDISINDIKCLYDKLLNRKSFNKTYSAEQIKRIVGVEYDPVKTEVNLVKLEELAKLKEKHLQLLKSLEDEYTILIDDMTQKLKSELEVLKTKATKEYIAECEKANKSLTIVE